MHYKTKPYKHQQYYLDNFNDRKYFALLAEMGTGKTWMIINNIQQLYINKKCLSALILAPNGVHLNWIEEFKKHSNFSDKDKFIAWQSSHQTKAYKKQIEDLLAYDYCFKCLIMNHEAISTKKGFDFAEKFCKAHGGLMIVLDESDSFKNPSAIRTKNIMKIRKYSAYRRIMTGTVVNNSPFDVFTQYNFLSHDILNCPSFYAFKTQYGVLLPNSSGLVQSIAAKTGRIPQIISTDKDGKPQYKNLNKLNALISPHSYRVLKKDCLDLPEKNYKNIYFELTPEQKTIYKKANDECRLILSNGNEATMIKIVALQKLAQITSGYFLHPTNQEPIKINGKNPKLDLLVDRVKSIVESGEKTIIWAKYRIEIADIAEKIKELGVKFVEYHGGISNADREIAINEFERGDAQIFIGNQQSGGVGITLVAASYVIYFSNSFSYQKRIQSEDRAHRIGQTKNVTYINLIAKNTIDEHILSALENKKDIAQIITDFKNKALK